MEIVNCFQCDLPAAPVEEPHTRMVGERSITFVDRFFRCPGCGEAFYAGDMANESLRRATAAIRAEDGLLAPQEITALRRRFGLTQAALERLIGAGPKTVVRWERGTVSQSRTADTLLRVLQRHPGVVAALAEERGVVVNAPSRAA